MVDSRKWYVLQVLTGSEIDVMAELQRRGVSAVVPIENRVIRSRGKWTEKEYIIFPGYVFINIRYSWSQYYIMSGIKSIVRILGGGGSPVPLTASESELLVKRTSLFRKPSVIRLTDDGYEVISGVLLELKDKIIHIDRHRRKVKVGINIAGKYMTFTLSFIPEEFIKS